jgi:hypothetical protein
MKHEKEEELLQHFDFIFGTNTIKNFDYYFSKIKMLENVYEVLEEDLCRTSPTYKQLRKQHIEISDMLENSFTKAQQTLFEKHLDIGSEMVAVENEQMFYFGYIMAKTLEQDIEITTKKE